MNYWVGPWVGYDHGGIGLEYGGRDIHLGGDLCSWGGLALLLQLCRRVWLKRVAWPMFGPPRFDEQSFQDNFYVYFE